MLAPLKAIGFHVHNDVTVVQIRLHAGSGNAKHRQKHRGNQHGKRGHYHQYADGAGQRPTIFLSMIQALLLRLQLFQRRRPIVLLHPGTPLSRFPSTGAALPDLAPIPRTVW